MQPSWAAAEALGMQTSKLSRRVGAEGARCAPAQSHHAQVVF